MIRTRSAAIPLQTLVSSPSHAVREDKSLGEQEPDYVLSDVRPFGDTIDKEYSLWLLVTRALADGAQRGRLFGKMRKMAWASFNGVEPAWAAHTTDTVVAYCAPNLVRTTDGTVYRIDSTAPQDSWSSRFELPTLRNTVDLPWPFGS